MRREGHVPAQLAPDAAPGFDQPLVQAVELVERRLPPVRLGSTPGRGQQVPEPEPLDDRRFQERRGGVGVVFEQLGRPGAVVGQVEPAVDRVLVALPAPGHELVERRGDVELAEPAVLDHVPDRLQAHLVEPVGGRLDRRRPPRPRRGNRRSRPSRARRRSSGRAGPATRRSWSSRRGAGWRSGASSGVQKVRISRQFVRSGNLDANDMWAQCLWKNRIVDCGLVQNRPFQGNSSADRSHGADRPRAWACQGLGVAREYVDQGRANRVKPSSSSQCECAWPVSSSAGVLPSRSGRSLRSSTRWFRKNCSRFR